MKSYRSAGPILAVSALLWQAVNFGWSAFICARCSGVREVCGGGGAVERGACAIA